MASEWYGCPLDKSNRSCAWHSVSQSIGMTSNSSAFSLCNGQASVQPGIVRTCGSPVVFL